MKRLLRMLVLCLVSGLLMSCTHLYLYMGDHGTYELKRCNVDLDPGHMTELVHLNKGGATWYLFVDSDPPRMFWHGEKAGTDYPVFWSDLDGSNVKHTTIRGLRRMYLDPDNDRIVYEVLSSGIYILRAKNYTQFGTNEFTELCTSAYPFSKIVVNPNNCGKIYWIETRETEECYLRELDIVTGTMTERINSVDHPFVKKIWRMMIDPGSHYVYWSQNLIGSVDDMVARANYIDGSGYEPWIYNLPGESLLASYPSQIAIDYVENRLYWADMNMNWIASAKMSGQTIEDRDFRVLVHYPLDQQTNGPNYHPTSIVLARIKGCMRDASVDIESTSHNTNHLPPDYKPPVADPGFVYPFE
ncbi:hypothetical protein JXA80_06435 [bacterium]|nr:hypothetical protein [candidate division CSSED10-310 bacterium]